jgi:hypothetical protein
VDLVVTTRLLLLLLPVTLRKLKNDDVFEQPLFVFEPLIESQWVHAFPPHAAPAIRLIETERA